MSTLRPTLGDFNSIVCTKAIVTGVEEALGKKAAAIAFISAGRARGRSLIDELGLSDKKVPLEELTTLMDKALGKEGTRLCIIDKIVESEGAYTVYTRETVCTAGEPDGSDRECSYTLGAVQGALEKILNLKLRGKHIEFDKQGAGHDVLQFTILGS
ncbi:MAG TPA: hypothetical protein V6C88_11985 [Chroococcidiopsis sp.]